MRESIKKLFNKLGFKHRDYEPPAKPRWKVISISSGYIYYKHKPINCPDVSYYTYTGNYYSNGDFIEAKAVTVDGTYLFMCYFVKSSGFVLPVFRDNDLPIVM